MNGCSCLSSAFAGPESGRKLELGKRSRSLSQALGRILLKTVEIGSRHCVRPGCWWRGGKGTESEHCSLLFPLGKLRLRQGLVGASPSLSRSIRFWSARGQAQSLTGGCVGRGARGRTVLTHRVPWWASE